ncbi:MAG: methyltransferase [Clostridia bacterium]|nr:methyltransferase [Clostridia bacterium]
MTVEYIYGFPVLTDAENRIWTDSLFLGYFVDFTPGGSVLDLGAGGGTLCFIAAGRGASRVVGVDKRAGSCSLLGKSAELSGLPVCAVHADVKELAMRESFGAVVCNPPYFAPGTGKVSPKAGVARTENTAVFADFARCAKRHLAPGGRFCFCMRPERFLETVTDCARAGLYPVRIRYARHSAGKTPFIFACETSPDVRPTVFEPDLLLDSAEGAGMYEAYRRPARVGDRAGLPDNDEETRKSFE